MVNLEFGNYILKRHALLKPHDNNVIFLVSDYKLLFMIYRILFLHFYLMAVLYRLPVYVCIYKCSITAHFS